MSKLTSALKGIGIGAAVIGISMLIGKKQDASANEEAAFNQNLKEDDEDIYDVKNETDINILREKHRLKMEAESLEQKKVLVFGACLLSLAALCAMVSWFAEHLSILTGLIAGVSICVITTIVLRHKRLMRQQDIDMLKTNVNAMGEDEAEERAKKYK